MTVYDVKHSKFVIFWFDVLALLFSKKHFEYLFIYILQVLNNRDDFNLKYNDSSLIIQDDISLFTDYDVIQNLTTTISSIQSFSNQQFIQKSQKFKITQTEISVFVSKQTKQFNENATNIFAFKIKLTKFFFKSVIIFKMKSIFQTLFFSFQKKKMLQYHDQMNVFTSNELFQ